MPVGAAFEPTLGRPVSVRDPINPVAVERLNRINARRALLVEAWHEVPRPVVFFRTHDC